MLTPCWRSTLSRVLFPTIAAIGKCGLVLQAHSVVVVQAAENVTDILACELAADAAQSIKHLFAFLPARRLPILFLDLCMHPHTHTVIRVSLLVNIHSRIHVHNKVAHMPIQTETWSVRHPRHQQVS